MVNSVGASPCSSHWQDLQSLYIHNFPEDVMHHCASRWIVNWWLNIYKRPITPRTLHFVCAECTDFSSLHTWTWWLHKWNHTCAKSKGSFSWDVNRLNGFWPFLHQLVLQLQDGINTLHDSWFASSGLPSGFNKVQHPTKWFSVNRCVSPSRYRLLLLRFGFDFVGRGDANMIPYLGGGFKDFLFSPLPGEMIPNLTSIAYF